MKTLTVALLLGATFMLSACSDKYVYNDQFFNKNGPLFIKAGQTSEPSPESIEISEPAFKPVHGSEMSVAEQNSKAISALNALGLEAQESQRGVVVYLPPAIYFASKRSDIRLEARKKISHIANEANKDYLLDRFIEVSGHCDAIGSEKSNLALSKLRAEAATSELVFSKVRLTRISTLWYGERKPRYSNFNDDGSVNLEESHLNRRVEFVILNPKEA